MMNQVNRFIRGVEELYELLDQPEKPCVAIIGAFNSGKSTLVNNLLGAEISAVGVVPTTNCLVTFDYGSAFRARYTGGRQYQSFHNMDQLRSFLINGLKTPSGRVSIEYPSAILKKCRLIDTPGIDSSCEARLLAEQAATEAGYVIYLFHQRGIEDLNRLFLYKLAAIWKKKDLNKLSFWVNCNHGLCDGSSLETTRAVLREIFLGIVRCNTINTRKPDSIEVFNQFLQVELARDTCRQAYRHLRFLDHDLPGRINKALRFKEDTAFLSEFWLVQETSRIILEAGKLLRSLPAVAGELERILKNANYANYSNLGDGHKKPGGQASLSKTSVFKEGKKKLLDLTTDLLDEKITAGLINITAIKDIAREIQTKRFTVVALGGFSTGKTTFFNALLKEDILPTADGPTTTAVTRITYGPNKKATIHFPLQITLSICERVGDRFGIYREQLQALERWLDPGKDIVASIECASGGFFQPIGKQELLERLYRIKEYYAAGAFARTTANRRIPDVFRLISQKAYKNSSFPDQVRVTFKESWSSVFNLAGQSGREQFRKALGPENAFRIEQVLIEYPSELLLHIDFLDTPGLDWIQKHYYQKSSRLVLQSDAYLFFLNGKHVLNQMDRYNFQAMFLPQPEAGFQSLSVREKRKYFFAINFADTLNSAEREAVCNFVRKNLEANNGKYTPVSGAFNVFLISALKALSGDDVQSICSLLKALEERALKYKATEFYQEKIAALFRIINEESMLANRAYLERTASGSIINRLRKEQKTLRYYRRRLKEIRRSISPDKPP